MNSDTKTRTKGWGRRAWDDHGSKLIVVILIALSWNAASEWERTKSNTALEIVIDSAKKERDDLRNRLRALSTANQTLAERNANLAAQLGPTVAKAEEAARTALAASDKATEASDKATQVLEKVDAKDNR